MSGDGASRPEKEPESEAEELAEEFLDRLQAGEEPDREEMLKAHGGAGEDLARRLKVVELLHRVGQKGLSSGSSLGRRPLHCPHCTSPVPIQEPGSGEVTCPSCRNSFVVSAGAAPAAAAGQLPERIGRFTVLGLLGRGAFGAVYRAHDPELHRTVAIKVPRSSFFGTKEEEERFLREARSAAGLLHPGIVKVHEIGEENSVPYLVTECIEGRTLSEVIAHRETSFEESARLVQQVAEMLHSAHSQKVIHRDVKPGNILIDRSGAPHLSDFGLARHVEEAVSVTLDGQVLGTPAYMSPEQAAGDQVQVGPRSDTYSLGVVLYELLTGERPFRGSRSMLVHQVLHEEPRPPRSLNQHIPRDLETVCLKAMAKEPRRRYPTALQFAEELGRFLRHQPVRARPVGKPERLWRWAKRNRAVSGLLAAVGVLLLLVAVVSATMAWRTARARDETRAQLARLNAVTAMRLADRGDLFGALPHLAEALRLDRQDPERREAHLYRLQAVIDRCPRLVKVLFHPWGIGQVELSPNDRMVGDLTGGRLEVHEFWTGRNIHPTGGNQTVLRFAFSPDNALVAAAFQDGSALVFRIDTSRPAGQPLRHQGSVNHVAWSPDGRLLATSSDDRTARLWDARSFEPAAAPLEHAGKVNSAAFSPDGRLLATASADSTVKLWETATGKLAAGPLVHRASVSMAVFSPDGLRLATASDDRTVGVWEVATGKPLTVLSGHENRVVRAAFSPDGDRIVTASLDCTARLWDAATGKETLAPIRHGLSVPFAEFTREGRSILSVSVDGTVRLTDPLSGEADVPPIFNEAGVNQAALSIDGRLMVTAGIDGTVRFWDLAGGEPSSALWSRQRRLSAAAFSPAGDRVATSGGDGAVRVWDVKTGHLAARAIHDITGIAHAVFSPDGRQLAGDGFDGNVRVWDVETGESSKPIPAHSRAIRALAFSGDGLRLLTASVDRTARVWDARSGEPVSPPLQHPAALSGAAFRPDGRRLVTACADGKARVWDAAAAAAGPPLLELKHESAVVAVCFSPTGARIATASEDASGRIWDAAAGAPVGEPLVHDKGLTAIRFSPDGRMVVTSSYDGTARVWSAADGRPLSPRLSHGGAVLDVGFSPDGRRVATASDDGTGRLWDVATGEQAIPSVKHGSSVRASQLSPDGRFLLTVSQDSSARLVSLPEPKLSVEDTMLLAQLLSGRRIDETGSTVNLTSEKFKEAWLDLSGRSLGSFRTAPVHVIVWHRRQAEALVRAGKWAAALLHVDLAITLEPKSWELHALRGELCAEHGDMKEAAASLRRAVELGPLDAEVFRDAAYTSLAAGELDRYRAMCRAFVERFPETGSLLLLNTMAWACSIGPGAIDDLKGLAGRLEKAIGSPRKARAAVNTLGAILYRAGEVGPAIAALEESRSLEGQGGNTEDCLFLAMAYHRQGRREDAAAALARAASLIDKALAPTAGPTSLRPIPEWYDRLTTDLLRREAEALLSQK